MLVLCGKKTIVPNPQLLRLRLRPRCAFSRYAPSGHLTGLKRKMPQLGIFPNCSLRSQLRLSPMLIAIFKNPKTKKEGELLVLRTERLFL